MSGVRTIGDVLLKLDNNSLSFGGVKALTSISFDVRNGSFGTGVLVIAAACL